MARKNIGTSPYTFLTVDQTTEMVNRAKEGDQRAFTKLFDRFKPIMYTIIRRRCPGESHEFYEDEVVAFLGDILGRKIDQFDRSKSQFSSWVTFCFNNWINSIPKRKKRVQTYSIEDQLGYNNPDDFREYPIEGTGNITKRTLNSIPRFITIARILLKHLPKKDVSIVIDKFWLGLHDREIEDKHGLAYKTSWYNYKRCLVKCKKVLVKYLGNDFV